MEMKRKDKSKSIVVDKLLMGTCSPFTRQVEIIVYPKSSRCLKF
jgi:hypothetical protein